MATIESVKEKLSEALAEVGLLLEEAEADSVLVDDLTFDELVELDEVIGGFLGDGPEEEIPE